MSPAESTLRLAQKDWELAMERWREAQEDIRAAKAAWSAAQLEFFTGITVLAPYTAGCQGCPKGGMQ